MSFFNCFLCRIWESKSDLYYTNKGELLRIELEKENCPSKEFISLFSNVRPNLQPFLDGCYQKVPIKADKEDSLTNKFFPGEGG